MNPQPPSTTLHIRDPFVIPDPSAGTYYVFGSTGIGNGREAPGFYYYASQDLASFSGPHAAFLAGADLEWARCFWAPEAFAFGGRWFMFASIGNDGSDARRAVYSLVADAPQGPYTRHSPDGLTPSDRMCIDGTLFVDSEGDPWLVYCHEWWQITNGAMCARRLTPDLSAGVGDSYDLFHAGDAAWTGNEPGNAARVTDGPFLHRTQDGTLLMLWSSFDSRNEYAVAVARSVSGEILGPWDVSSEPLIGGGVGHAMLFRTFRGTLALALHSQANGWGQERAMFLPIDDRDSSLLLEEAGI